MCDDDFLTTNEFALLLGASRGMVMSMIHDGKLKVTVPGRRNMRIRVCDAREYCVNHDIKWPHNPAAQPE